MEFIVTFLAIAFVALVVWLFSRYIRFSAFTSSGVGGRRSLFRRKPVIEIDPTYGFVERGDGKLIDWGQPVNEVDNVPENVIEESDDWNELGDEDRELSEDIIEESDEIPEIEKVEFEEEDTRRYEAELNEQQFPVDNEPDNVVESDNLMPQPSKEVTDDDDLRLRPTDDAGTEDIQKVIPREPVEPALEETKTESESATREINSDDGTDESSVDSWEVVGSPRAIPQFQESDDRLIDIVAWLPEQDELVAKMQVLSICRPFESTIDRPYSIIGLDVNSGRWSRLDADQVTVTYSDLLLTMQLSYNGQPINMDDWSKFIGMVKESASSLSRTYQLSLSIDEVFQEAECLTERIENLNLQAVLMLRSDVEEQFSQTSMNYVAREFGFERRRGSDIYDKFQYGVRSNHPIFSMINAASSKEILEREIGQTTDSKSLVLFCNLPCVDNPRHAFDLMLDAARELEDRLGVKLVDQNYQTINENSVAKIREIIDEFVAEMIDFGITPGREAALRLFGKSQISSPIGSEELLMEFDPV